MTLRRSPEATAAFVGDPSQGSRKARNEVTTAPNQHRPKVSIIIPVYNAAAFLRECLDSVMEQTEQRFEIVAVNDGSTDGSLAILEHYSLREPRMRVIDQENRGQGAARNRALTVSTGDYILFLDADDYLDPVALETTIQRADTEGSDLVHFDWKMLTNRGVRYFNTAPYWQKALLKGDDCVEILKVKNLYAWVNLYRRSFLDENGICFEEGRIYEDNPFVAKVAGKARCISLVHAPLYVLRPHAKSTTRSDTHTSRHFQDHLHAIRISMQIAADTRPSMLPLLAAYHFHKFLNYRLNRIPPKLRQAYTNDLVKIYHDFGATAAAPQSHPFFKASDRLGVFRTGRPLGLSLMLPFLPTARMGKRVARKAIALAAPGLRVVLHDQAGERGRRGKLRKGLICFLGFDTRYEGNSRFLFEELISSPEFTRYEIRFVTDDRRVPHGYRLPPSALSTTKAVSSAEVVIAESWVPKRMKKHPGSLRIQMWHGTPIKRLLFDAHETQIERRKKTNKNSKYDDIQTWDYILSSNPKASRIYGTAFHVPQARIIEAEAPRVSYAKAKDTVDERAELRRLVLGTEHIARKAILYLPTWRDRNYGLEQDQRTNDYLLDLKAFADRLGDDYVILFRNHPYLGTSARTGHPNVVDFTGSEHDTQELIVVSDVLVTDYSSAAFDALQLGRTVVIYAPDHEAFARDRGFYASTWQDFASMAHGTMEETATAIEKATNTAPGMRSPRSGVNGANFSTSTLAEVLRTKLIR